MVVRVGRVSDGSRVDCRTVVVSVRVSLGGMPRHDTLFVGDTECCSVERLGVDNDATFDHVPYELFG